jgi:ubiquinone/menaquinone biosynthesis C-methylase UbiE
MSLSEPTQRFSNRVDAYVRYRPSYPPEVVDALERHAGLHSTRHVADVGSGTGILTAQLLPRCARVYAVEPNDAMRAAAESALGRNPGFVSIAAAAEATTLPDASVDLVTAAQAFHWFDRAACRREFQRILSRDGMVALVWNERQISTTPFLADYEALLQRYGVDYRQVTGRNVNLPQLGEFYGGPFTTLHFPHAQDFDFPALAGRLLSSSYAPTAGHPDHAPMLAALSELFAEHQAGGRVAFLYDTRVHVGRIQ